MLERAFGIAPKPQRFTSFHSLTVAIHRTEQLHLITTHGFSGPLLPHYRNYNRIEYRIDTIE